MYCAEVLPGASASMMLRWLWRTLIREDSVTLDGKGVMTDVVDMLGKIEGRCSLMTGRLDQLWDTARQCKRNQRESIVQAAIPADSEPQVYYIRRSLVVTDIGQSNLMKEHCIKIVSTEGCWAFRPCSIARGPA